MIERGAGVVAGRGPESPGARGRRRRAGGAIDEEAFRIVMPTFAYSGRTRAGQTVTGERVADTLDAAVARAAARADPGHADRSGEGARPTAEKQAEGARAGQVGAVEEPRDLHAPVLGHDRRRPAARAVPRHPRQAGAAQELLRRHPQGAGRRRSGRGARRRDEEAPEDVRRALREHDRGGRGGRHPRHDPQAAGGLHREERQAEGRSQVRDDLPDRGHRHRRGGRRRDSVEGHPDLRAAVRRPRRAAAAADPDRHRRSNACRVRLDADRRARRARLR